MFFTDYKISTQLHCKMKEECPICLNPLTRRGGAIETLGCRHTFHRHCIENAIDNVGKTCPMCRQEITEPGYLAIRTPVTDVEKAALLAIYTVVGIATPRDMDFEAHRFSAMSEENSRFRSIVRRMVALLNENSHPALTRRRLDVAIRKMLKGDTRQLMGVCKLTIEIFRALSVR